MNLIKIPLSVFTKRSCATVPDCIEINKGAWIAGGAVRNMVSGKKHDSDYDLFFKSEMARNEQLETLSKAGFIQVRSGANFRELRRENLIVQAISFEYHPTLESLFEKFDFTICQFAIEGDFVVTTPEAMTDLAAMRLVCHKITFPVATIRRLLKYQNKGFRACGGTLKEILTQSKEIDLNSAFTQYID